jgi:hypothetical protein
LGERFGRQFAALVRGNNRSNSMIHGFVLRNWLRYCVKA